MEKKLSPFLLKLAPSAGVIAITVIVFILTKNPITSPFSLHMTLASLIVLLIYIYYIKKQGKAAKETKTFIFLVSLFILFLVSATGWFFSPFFFSLYLLTILLAFVFYPTISLSFVVTLVGLFSLNIGEVDLAYDFLVVLSLLTVIPLSFYLKKEYLRIKEGEKKILVLKKEGKAPQGKVEEILSNKVNDFAVNLRQPINDIKQLAYRLSKVRTKETAEKNRERIIASSEEALRMLKNFEEKVTGKTLLITPEDESQL